MLDVDARRYFLVTMIVNISEANNSSEKSKELEKKCLLLQQHVHEMEVGDRTLHFCSNKTQPVCSRDGGR